MRKQVTTKHPCPFCGRYPWVTVSQIPSTKYGIYCTGSNLDDEPDDEPPCPATLECSPWFETEQDAIAAWDEMIEMAFGVEQD